MIHIRKNILIVDDDEDILYCFQLTLENEHTVVYTANHPEEALAILQVTSIDLAILDFILPTMTGAPAALP